MKDLTLVIKVEDDFKPDGYRCARRCPFYAVDFYSDEWDCIFQEKCPVKEYQVNGRERA